MKDKKYSKVRVNCHYTGEYRAAAHSIYNLKYRVPKKIPIYLSSYHKGVSKRIYKTMITSTKPVIAKSQLLIICQTFFHLSNMRISLWRFIGTVKSALEDHSTGLSKMVALDW